MGNGLPTNGHDNPVDILTDYLNQQAARLDAQAAVMEKTKQKSSAKEKQKVTPWEQDRLKIRDAILSALEQGQITSDSVHRAVKKREAKPMMLELALEAEEIYAQSQRAGLILEMHVDKDRAKLLVELEKSGLSSDVFDQAIISGRLNIGQSMGKIMWAILQLRNKELSTVKNRTQPVKAAAKRGDNEGRIKHSRDGGKGLRPK